MFTSSAPEESPSPLPKNAHETVSDIRRDIAKANAKISDVHHDVTNSQAMISKMLKDQEKTKGQDRPVSVARTLFFT